MAVKTQPRRPSLLYRFLVALIIPCLLYSAVLIVDLLLHPLVPDASYNSVVIRLLSGLLIAPGNMFIGILLVRRVPGNMVGPLLFVWGFGNMGAALATNADQMSVAIATFGITLGWWAFLALIFYFPDGYFYPPRASRWPQVLLLSTLVVFASYGFAAPLITTGNLSYPNPFLISALEAIYPTFINVPIIIITLLVGIGSMILRYRASRMRERQQMKWFAWLVSVFVVFSMAGSYLDVNTAIGQIYQTLATAVPSVIPGIGIGVGILRHRLFDIDIIIRRTLIYSVLTAILALIYFGGVVLAQAALRPVIGENTDAGIVISTLAIAALFSPLRRRVQNIIDRRFYRRKYDAERTLAAFNATMRDEVDLDKLQAALVNLVHETMQPKVVGLWIQKPEHNRFGEAHND